MAALLSEPLDVIEADAVDSLYASRCPLSAGLDCIFDINMVAASSVPDPGNGLFSVTLDSLAAGAEKHNLALFLAVVTPSSEPTDRNLCGMKVRAFTLK